MTIWGRVSAQFGKPSGPLGGLAGTIMARRRSNVERNNWVISLLGLKSTDRVMEIGFGPGIAIQQMAQSVKAGSILGIDHSEVMLRQASRRNREALSTGRVTLLLCSVADIPPLERPVNKILAVNSFQFWDAPEIRLLKLRTCLEEGGMIALAHQPRKPGATNDDAARTGISMARFMEEAGFVDMTVHTKNTKPVATVCVLGRNPVV